MFMSMGVKSEKTFEEIVERLAALFRLKPRPGDRDYEQMIDVDPAFENPPAVQKEKPLQRSKK